MLLARLIGISLVSILITAVFAAWYISRSPIDLGFFKPRIEAAITAVLPDYKVDIGSAVLTFDHEDRSSLIVLSELAFVPKDGGSEAAELPRIEMKLANNALVRGLLRPKDLRVEGQALELRRLAVGRYSVSLFPLSTESRLYTEFDLERETQRAIEQAPSSQAQQDVILSHALSQFEAMRRDTPFFQQLRTIAISLKRLSMADSVGNRAFAANDLQLAMDVRRSRMGLALTASAFSLQVPQLPSPVGGFATRLDMDLEGGSGQAQMSARLALANQLVDVTVKAELPDSGKPELDLSFSELRPSGLTSLHPLAKQLSEVNLPIAGKASLQLGRDLQPLTLDFDLKSGRGEAAMMPFYRQPLLVEAGSAKGHLDVPLLQLTVKEAKLTFPLSDGSLSQASGQFYFDFQAKDGSAIEQIVDVVADRSDVQTGLRFWPECRRNSCLRTWFAEAELLGEARNIRFRQHEFVPYDIALDPDTRLREGSFGFVGGQMRAWPHLPLIEGGLGSVKIGTEQTSLTLEPGAFAGVAKWGAAAIQIEHKVNQRAEIRLQGSADAHLRPLLATLAKGQIGLEVLNTLPLDLLSGKVTGDVSLAMRLPNPGQVMGPQDVAFEGQGSAQDLGWQDIAGASDVSGGNLRFAINPQGMQGEGQAMFDGAPLNLSFVRSFDLKSAQRNQVKVTSRLPVVQVLGYLPFLTSYLTDGSLSVEASYEDDWNGDGHVVALTDMQAAGFQLPFLSMRKPAGQRGSVDVAARLRGGRPVQIEGLDLRTYRAGQSEPVFAVRGQGHFSEQTGDWQALAFDEVRFERTILRGLRAENRPDALHFSLGGGQFDAKAIFEAMKQSGQASQGASQITSGKPIVFNAPSVDHVLLPSNNVISDVSFYGERVGTLWHRIEFAGTMPFSSVTQDKVPRAELAFAPLGTGGYELFIETVDAGALLKTLGYWENMNGGFMRFKGKTQGPLLSAPLIGSLAVQDFYVVDAPIVSSLFNLVSLTGISDLLNNRGLWMEGMSADLRFDRGLLDLRKVQLAGPSVGISLEGQIDMPAQQISLAGTLAPFNFLGQALEDIPLFGELLTGTKREGFLAADFTVNGAFAGPVVSVNPLTALAPGILREMFNEIIGNISPHESR